MPNFDAGILLASPTPEASLFVVAAPPEVARPGGLRAPPPLHRYEPAKFSLRTASTGALDARKNICSLSSVCKEGTTEY